MKKRYEGGNKTSRRKEKWEIVEQRKVEGRREKRRRKKKKLGKKD